MSLELPLLKPKHAKQACKFLINNFLTILLIPISLTISINILLRGPYRVLDIFNPLEVVGFLFLAVCIAATYVLTRPRAVYLVDFACFLPPNSLRVPNATAIEHGSIILKSQPKNFIFQQKISERSGLGDETSLPNAIHYIPPTPTVADAREESEMVIFSAIDSLFEKTGISPKDIDILILNCSIFSPTPSLSCMIVNKYKLRSNVRSYNLSGMGCSAGLISMDLARHLLQVHRESNAVIISTEILSPNSYMGKERSMLLPNFLFRMGGAAILLTNKKSLRKQSKYRLQHLVRTHKGAEDRSYRCVQQEEDPAGHIGIALQIDLMVVAGESLKSNITSLGPLVLPASEKLLFAITFIARKILKLAWKPYIPDFTEAFEHFCIHAGGRAVIDELQKSLKLSSEHVEASRMALHRFGNTSSSSLWYELSYIEAKGKMKKGDRVWQIGFGSGFKCNSAVWKCNRSLGTSSYGPWANCIHRYPVDVPEVMKI